MEGQKNLTPARNPSGKPPETGAGDDEAVCVDGIKDPVQRRHVAEPRDPGGHERRTPDPTPRHGQDASALQPVERQDSQAEQEQTNEGRERRIRVV